MSRSAQADEQSERFFENHIRPILSERCGSCHDAKKQSGGLRTDSRQALLAGGESGPAIVPGEADASRLIQAVRREGALQMPPKKSLEAREIELLASWINRGASWPETKPAAASSSAAETHWAFQPVREPSVPQPARGDWIRTPVDAFVLERLEQSGLSPSPEADRRTLIRRVSYALTGLPPTPAEVERFLNDTSPGAYERLVDRLLESPHYGEQWARHWLDVARYSDTKGYVYAREERFWVHAWSYRDWVVRALNEDMPYDRFLLLQLAADQVPDRRAGDLAAMGYLTLGRRFLGVKHDIIDDRIDVVCRGTMALTVGCARCHDHKYDPIPTADYYSLYGVFDSCSERLVPLDDTAARRAAADYEAFEKELQARQEKLQTTMAQRRLESANRVRERVADYLYAQTELHKYPAEGFDQIFQEDDLLPAFVRRWEAYLRQAEQQADPVFVPWLTYARLPSASFAELAAEATRQIQSLPAGAVNPLIADAFKSPPSSMAEVSERYGQVFQDADRAWQKLLEQASQDGEQPLGELPDAAAEELRQVLYGPQAPCEVPDEPIVHSETYFDSASCTELWKLQGEVDRWIINSQVEAPYALTLVDRDVPSEPRVFQRGNPLNKGEQVPRHFLSVLAEGEPKAFARGSGRWELARAIIDPGNPLTARVIVNRVWTHHFGEGLVATPSDFGTRAGEPSHPELLDWLAARFVAEGWSLKTLHRWMLLSATFRQSSAGPDDPGRLAAAVKLDPGNRLLWRTNQRRLTFEEFRDSMLAASQELNLQLGGKPVPLFEPPLPQRRTLYGLVDRQFLPSTLRMFDFANPDLHTPQRAETTVPQQALFFLNHPLVLERARALAAADEERPAEQRVRAMFARTLQREPTARELADAMQLVSAAERPAPEAQPATADDWQYGYGSVDEPSGRVTGFTPLPHFTGEAWQGGSQFPDPKLGWVQLTAEGGHPGNDRQHAAVRRWTAPRDMSIAIRSQLRHEPAAGDGIRAFIVSSRTGILQSTRIHQQSVDVDVESVEVERGETIDFVVDIGDVLNSDQYLWNATVTETAGGRSSLSWNSQNDFSRDTVRQLGPWEQLAQVLLCTNEFMFVD